MPVSPSLALPPPFPLCHAPCSRRPTLWHFSLVFALLFFFATFLIWTPAQHATKSSSSTVVDVVAKICGCHLIKSARQLSPDSVPAAPLTTSPHPQADLPTITSSPPTPPPDRVANPISSSSSSCCGTLRLRQLQLQIGWQMPLPAFRLAY